MLAGLGVRDRSRATGGNDLHPPFALWTFQGDEAVGGEDADVVTQAAVSGALQGLHVPIEAAQIPVVALGQGLEGNTGTRGTQRLLESFHTNYVVIPSHAGLRWSAAMIHPIPDPR